MPIICPHNDLPITRAERAFSASEGTAVGAAATIAATGSSACQTPQDRLADSIGELPACFTHRRNSDLMCACLSLLAIGLRHSNARFHDFGNVLRSSFSVDRYVPLTTPIRQIRHIHGYFHESDSSRLHLLPSLLEYCQPLLIRILKTVRIGRDLSQLLPFRGRIPSNTGNRFVTCSPFCDLSSISLSMEHDPS